MIGVDVESPPCRGHIHHRFLLWVADGVLSFVSKYPPIEKFESIEETFLLDLLRQGAMYWNTYFCGPTIFASGTCGIRSISACSPTTRTS
jgi:hypothetical protein